MVGWNRKAVISVAVETMKPSVCYEVMYTLAEYQYCLSCQCPSFVMVTLTEGSIEIHCSLYFF